MSKTVKLRDKSKVKDVRLSRLVQFDERSRAYPIRTAITNQTPRSYTWACNKWLDQGQEGACVGFSVSHELAGKPVEVAGITDKFAREKIYWEAQKLDEWAGGSYPGARPFYEGTSVLCGIKAAQNLGYIGEYRWAFGLDDLILAVGRKGPAVLGINWYEGMFNVDEKGFVHVQGEIAGGHAILCNGVNLPGKYFKLHNSWGKSWGRSGECMVSFSDMSRLLDEQGEAVIPLSRKL